ncbi:hypothetical protein [Changpingibacter yushuensis]|uniref:hypothetical protein n=1 Tax=Changpingibacter yushuensis TaxID=2758440 RepID=UPI001CB756CB|nr:hypothetical protein [Changpingibacter yushuensis]
MTAPDMELWLCAYLRSVLADEGVDAQVSNKEPDSLKLPLSKPLVVIRDDSGTRQSAVTFDRSIGVSILAGTRQDDKASNDLARRIAGILSDDEIAMVPGSPIAAVDWDGCNGPYAVTETLNVARRYLTVQYTVVGSW